MVTICSQLVMQRKGVVGIELFCQVYRTKNLTLVLSEFVCLFKNIGFARVKFPVDSFDNPIPFVGYMFTFQSGNDANRVSTNPFFGCPRMCLSIGKFFYFIPSVASKSHGFNDYGFFSEFWHCYLFVS